jgi:hypothetical protein
MGVCATEIVDVSSAAATTAHEAIVVRMGVLFPGMALLGNDQSLRSFLPPPIISIRNKQLCLPLSPLSAGRGDATAHR